MPIISGTLQDGAGHPVADCNIILKALNTTNAVIMTTTASVGTNAGQYRIDALPGRYEVTLAVESWPPQKVGVINVYADSPDGSLNDYLTTISGDYLMPDMMKQFEQIRQQTRAAAEQARNAADGMEQIRTDIQTARDAAAQAGKEAEGNAQQAALSAGAAGKSEAAAAGAARQSGESAAASENSRKASDQSAAAAATSARNAGESD
ncbi:hypothetical protein HAZ28_004958, partial [Salmonella enterica]|nr:hypothetical protein [Salmonella enterica]